MPINRRIFSQDAAVAAGDADQVEGLVVHLDANDEDSIESGGANQGNGSGTWFDIANHNVNVPLIDKGTNLVLHLNASDTNSYSGSGNTWTDLSTYGNDGAISNTGGTNNATFESDTRGYFDFERDDGNNNVEVTDSSSLDITTNITLEAWINEESPIVNYGRLFWKNGAYALYRGTNGWNFLTGSDVLVHNSGIPSTGTWYHIAATYDGANKKLYINGTLVDTEPETASIPTNNNSLYIGGIDSSRFFDGKVSSVRIYDVALTASEVAQNYRANSFLSYDSPYTTDVLVDYRPSNYVSGTTLPDVSGNSNTANLLGGIESTYDKELGDSFDLAGGSSGDRIESGTSVSFNTQTDGMTVEIWFKPDADSQSYIWSADQSGTTEFNISIRSGRDIHWFYQDTSGQHILSTGSSAYALNEWHCLICTTDGSTAEMYLDGVLEDSHSTQAESRSFSGDLYFGDYFGGSNGYYGMLGTCRFWKKGLTAAQAYQNYLATKNDYPNGHNGTISGADFDTNSSSPNESYFDFSGATSDLITIADDSIFDFTANTSMEVWLTKGTTNHHIINKKDGASQESWAFWTNGSAFYFYPYNTSNQAPNIVTTSTLNATWNHVTVTVGSSLDFELYLNGSSEATGTVTGTMKTDSASVKIGSYNGSIAYAGKIAMVKFFAKELSASEVLANYNATKATFGIS